jgi:hypothetical protein
MRLHKKEAQIIAKNQFVKTLDMEITKQRNHNLDVDLHNEIFQTGTPFAYL